MGYHPCYHKTALCQARKASSCQRGSLCAFVHKSSETRVRATECTTDYRVPLSRELVAKRLQPDFRTPPFQGCEPHNFAHQNFHPSSEDRLWRDEASVSGLVAVVCSNGELALWWSP